MSKERNIGLGEKLARGTVALSAFAATCFLPGCDYRTSHDKAADGPGFTLRHLSASVYLVEGNKQDGLYYFNEECNVKGIEPVKTSHMLPSDALAVVTDEGCVPRKLPEVVLDSRNILSKTNDYFRMTQITKNVVGIEVNNGTGINNASLNRRDRALSHLSEQCELLDIDSDSLGYSMTAVTREDNCLSDPQIKITQ